MGKVVHFEILSGDPARAAAFYEDVLGWSCNTWQGSETPYILVDTGGTNGAIMGRHFPQAVINTAEVDDLDAALERVRNAGGKLVHGPNEIPGIGTHAYCTDPDGTWFGLLQPLPREAG